MKKQEAPRLFPFPLVEGNVEGLQARHRRGSRMIYLTVMLGLLAAVACLPLIEVEVNSRSRGVLRPGMKLTPVTSPVSGKVTLVSLRENEEVKVGDTLLTISTEELNNETAHLREQLEERRLLIADLEQLTTENGADYPTLSSAIYQRDYRDYRQRRDEAKLKLEHARRHLRRQQELIETGSIARMELEQAEYELGILEGQAQQLSDQQNHLWTQELQRNRRERAELRQQLSQLATRAKQHIVTAPVAGHLTQTGGLQAGGYAAAGQALALISPHGELRVETYVSPSDIGLLKVGLPVNLQLDAFNYNQWGLARATLTRHLRARNKY